MNICLIGLGIPSLILANILAKKNIKISILDEEKTQKKISNRTIGITKTNINYLKKENIIIGNYAWKINGIKIFKEQWDKKELLNFGPLNDQLFSVIKNSDFKNLLRKKTKKNKLIKIIKLKKISFYESIIKNKSKFDLIINFNQHNTISKKIFFKRDNKDYNSLAYTCSIKHKKCANNVAYQIFTKNGPIAFLPCSRSETSIVYSFMKQNNQTTDKKIFNLIEKYNRKYSIESFSKLETFELKGSHLKNYFYKNILCFGDNLHRIHPLAGQGFNMSIRDIKTLSSLIDKKIELGLPLDLSILSEFEKKTKHLNFIFANGVDFIHEFFKLDNKIGNNYSKEIFKFLEKNKFIKNSFSKFADKGLVI